MRYQTPAQSSGMRTMRQIAEVLSVGIQVEVSRILGDALGVSYAGKSGRDGVFRADSTDVSTLSQRCVELGKSFSDDCRQLSEWGLSNPIKFGASQALLRAHASVSKMSLTAFLCKEYSLPLPSEAVALHGSCGYDWNDNADKMVFYRLESLPAGQGDDLPNRLGKEGEKLIEYVTWLKGRVGLQQNYSPAFHFDLHGGLDLVLAATEIASRRIYRSLPRPARRTYCV
ncbi:MAG: hypothetical protein R3B54_06695 [Bdellovibrionota bacterium]